MSSRVFSTSTLSAGSTSRIPSCSRASGTVREAFTPDFYLPDLGIYVECTVLRQSLTHRKRRRVRKTLEQEGVRVQVLFGQDLARLAERWSLTELAAAAEQRGDRAAA